VVEGLFYRAAIFKVDLVPGHLQNFQLLATQNGWVECIEDARALLHKSL
jgi:hypothetical protein